MQFGDRLKEARISKGISQDDLAALVGSTKQVVSKYENNQRTPKVTVANQYAEALGVTLNYLLGEEKPATTEDDGISELTYQQKVLLGKALKLNDENRAKAEGYLDSLLADQNNK